MTDTIATATPRRSRDESIAELRRLRAEIAEANPDLTDKDWDALAERWAAEVNAAPASQVRGSREEPETLRPR